MVPLAIPDETAIRVAHADVILHMAFSNSVRRWHRETDEGDSLDYYPGDCERISVGVGKGVEIDGDCSNGVLAPNGGLVHINGNLTSELTIDGHYEIVIAGDVSSEATIRADGFCHVFVGRNFSGTLIANGSTRLWIDHDFLGTIKTGTPNTEVHIGRNYVGRILPNFDAALLSLDIAGYASEESLTRIAGFGYTQFNASVGVSDVPPGLYPKTGYHRKTASGNSFNRWSVALEKGNNKLPNVGDDWLPNLN